MFRKRRKQHYQKGNQYYISDSAEDNVTGKVSPIMIQPSTSVDLTSDDEDNSTNIIQNANVTSGRIQELLARVMKEITNEGITMGIFAKVVINATNDTLTRLFQSDGVGYENYVEMIVNFLNTVPLIERRQKYDQQMSVGPAFYLRKRKERSAVQQILKSPPMNSALPILMHFNSVSGTEESVSSLNQSKSDEFIKQVLCESEPDSPGGVAGPMRRIRNRTYISDEAKRILNEYFDHDPYPSWNNRDLLGRKVGLSSEVIRIYFQNRRRILGSDKQINLGTKDWK